jgi:hypothetical protein
VNQRHLKPELPQRGGCLQTDEAAADDDGAFAGARRVADRSRVGDGAEAEDRVEVVARHPQPPRRRARRQQQLVIDEETSVAEHDGAGCGIDGDHPRSEQHVDVLVAVKGLVLDVRRLRRLAAQVLLGQRRTVVGKRRLLADEGDSPLAARLAIRGDRARGGQSTAGDHELASVHRSSFARSVHAFWVSAQPELLRGWLPRAPAK